jgi:hypothetical protein
MLVSYSAAETEDSLTSEVSEVLSSATLEVLSSEVVESVPSSAETVELVLVVEVSPVELVVLPPQATMLRTSIRAIIETISFFMLSFPFENWNLLQATRMVTFRRQTETHPAVSRYRV